VSDSPRIPTRGLPLIIGATVVLVAAIVAVAIGFNNANTTGVVTATPTPSPSAKGVTTPCAHASFGSALTPLNPPANLHEYPAPPPTEIDNSKLYQATISTAKGDLVLCLQPKMAPITVNNFVVLARNHFYDGVPFHRVVPGFVIQGGDPSCIGKVPPAPATPGAGCGSGGPGYQFGDEPVKGAYVEGCLAMANSGPNTNGSQFFICTANDTSQLQDKYNLFGDVQSGLDVALRTVQGDLMNTVTVRAQQ